MDHAEPVASQAAGTRGPHAAPLRRRVVSALVLLPGFVWVVVFAPAWVFGVLVALVGALGQWEFLRMFRRAGIRTLTAIGLVGGVAVTVSFSVPGAMPAVLTLVVLAVLAAGVAQRRNEAAGWESPAVTLLGVCYVNVLLGHALWLRGLDSGADWVLLLVWVTWIGETAAYLVGSAIGRWKLAPRISPRKTVEGAVAQFVASPAAALVAQPWLFPERAMWDAAAVGVLLGVAGQVGDLAESLLKRSAGTKDSGGLIPGHGGILDRVDGLLFNTPVLFYYVSHGRAFA